MISFLPSTKYRFRTILLAGGYSGIMLMCSCLISFFFSRQRDLSQYATVDSSAMVFIAYSILGFFVAWRELYTDPRKFGTQLLLKSPLLVFFIYTLYGFASIVWSVSIPLTGYRSFECLSKMLLIVATIQNLFRHNDRNIVFEWSSMYIAFQALVAIFSALRWTTSIAALLQRSQMDATCFFFIALYTTSKNWRHILIILMSLFSMSTTAYIGMALGLISMYRAKVSSRTKMLIVAFTITIITVVAYMGPKNFLQQTIFLDHEQISIEDTSGRNHIMDAVIESVKEQPWGYGFFAGEPYVLYSRHLGAINGHNSIFSAGLGVGIPGMILMALFFILIGFKVFGKSIPREVRGPLIGCFFVAFLHCMGNPGLGSRVYGSWTPTLYIFTLICAYSKIETSKTFPPKHSVF